MNKTAWIKEHKALRPYLILWKNILLTVISSGCLE